MDSRWACGPLAAGEVTFNNELCDIDFSLNFFRYVRQIQLGGCFFVLPCSPSIIFIFALPLSWLALACPCSCPCRALPCLALPCTLPCPCLALLLLRVAFGPSFSALTLGYGPCFMLCEFQAVRAFLLLPGTLGRAGLVAVESISPCGQRPR